MDDEEECPKKPWKNLFTSNANSTLIRNQSFMRGLASIRKLQQTQANFHKNDAIAEEKQAQDNVLVFDSQAANVSKNNDIDS